MDADPRRHAALATPENETIRVIGQPVNDAGLLIEITMPTEPLRMALIDYGLRILALSPSSPS
jgi:hypothetical protein